MLLFLTLYFSTYLLMHCYAYIHAWRSLRFDRKVMVPLAAWTILMILSPIIVRLAEREGYEAIPKLLAYVSYSWMGLLFIFLTVAFLYDTGNICRWGYSRVRGEKRTVSALSRRRSLYARFTLVLAIYCYGLYEANQIRTEYLVIPSPRITSQQEELRIVQISDVHIGLIVRNSRLEKILSRVREADPDVLVSTGDLVDGQLDNLDQLAEALADIEPPLGKIAVTGNHEFYAGLSDALDFTEKAGFKVLRNESYQIRKVTFVGVDDSTIERFGGKPSRTEDELLRKHSRDSFTVLLKHRPVIEPASAGLFDLQLSGHTHKGQIFPFNLFTWLSFRFPNGLNRLEAGMLYISRGSGTWGPPIRFLAPPEVTVIDVVQE